MSNSGELSNQQVIDLAIYNGATFTATLDNRWKLFREQVTTDAASFSSLAEASIAFLQNKGIPMTRARLVADEPNGMRRCMAKFHGTNFTGYEGMPTFRSAEELRKKYDE